MEEYEIELYEPMTIAGRKRPAGWKGIVTKSYVTLMRKAGAGIVLRHVPREEAKQLRQAAKKARTDREKAIAESEKAKAKAAAEAAKEKKP